MTLKSAIRATTLTMVACVLTGIAARVLAGEEHAHAAAPATDMHAGHLHSASAAMIANMQLDDGRKWPTDAPLRTGMAAIRTAFEGDHAAIHAGTETDAQYEALATRIEQEVQGIIANFHLPPAADATLHHAIADLTRGIGIMRGKDPARECHEGAALVHGALLAYAKYFDDPSATEQAARAAAGGYRSAVEALMPHRH